MEMKMNQILRFRADEVVFEECDDEYVAHVFLRSMVSPEKHYLMINRSVNPRKKSEVFLEFDDQSQVAHGGVVGCELRSDGLTLELAERTAAALGIPNVRQVMVDFELAWGSLSELRRALAAIFADHDRYQDKIQE